MGVKISALIGVVVGLGFYLISDKIYSILGGPYFNTIIDSVAIAIIVFGLSFLIGLFIGNKAPVVDLKKTKQSEMKEK